MRREVGAELELRTEGDATALLSIAVSSAHPLIAESLAVTRDGVEQPVDELVGPHGARLHELDLGAGVTRVSYAATVDVAPTASVGALDAWTFTRPSRYCESDRLAATAQAEFDGLAGVDLLDAVSSWVGTRLEYVPGSSGPTDGAVQTLLQRTGVCRDYAHLVVALLRARGVPARLVSVYAPGLDPMDFHAVAEALIDERWLVVDATTLAPRSSLVRIATGRDAADTAFLTSRGAAVTLERMEVTAVADTLPDDDVREGVELS
ncbi:transglutaminase family protein [Schumannella sp. 10F1B-5-1]|uniref:transglutaminase-like domain-containing protein n=1 Tax=Schumannella sp. 10F1B-5-1 TaxID=2590780 RepID=UPI001131A0C1|nr:transglutaminase family protein [Schumannella sp. 10F1B-5-1]TPW78330.1 transglutaminase family protein [Schumannella sp. 10F1B-5-1]